MRKVILLCSILSAMALSNHIVSYFVNFNFANQYKVNDKDKTKILLVWGEGVGEHEQTYRFRIVAERLGIDLRVVSSKEKNVISQHYLRNKPSIAAKTMQPHLILTIERHIQALPDAPNFLVLDQSKDEYLFSKGSEVSIMPISLRSFTGFLPTFPEIDLLKAAVTREGRNFEGFVWYPTVYATEFVPQIPKKLFYPGGILRDITRSSEKYKQIFKLLDLKGYLEVYGSQSKWQHTPKSIRPSIPFDGVSLLKVQNAAGISLVLHDAEHLNGNVPSGRIFEAAAANTVIIADKLKFIEDNFGNNVLYIDVSKSPDDVAAQIDQHVRWILSNPQQAQQMAQNCHTIFLQKFTLEQQLKKLLDLI